MSRRYQRYKFEEIAPSELHHQKVPAMKVSQYMLRNGKGWG